MQPNSCIFFCKINHSIFFYVNLFVYISTIVKAIKFETSVKLLI